MSTGGAIVLIVIVVLVGIFVALAVIDNTVVLHKEKELRARLKQLSIDADAMPDDASPQEVAALQARVTAASLEINEFLRSPFVIQRGEVK